ncbi:30S ribosomal protein S1 [Tribonema minus]|uniref:30S ribosomal protein S1 n=1 Tax=Tribonema minus TaxID=303371 RepID=A0A836CHC1_9STRA|nr:30S ribosomal protein S1 [Tribonema minus]
MRCVSVPLQTAVLLGLVSGSAAFAFAPNAKVVVHQHRLNRAISNTRSRLSVRMSTVAPADLADNSAAASKTLLADLVVGQQYEGVVSNVLSYGAFVDIGAEANGLVHISQLADAFVSNPTEIVAEGDSVSVKVLSIDQAEKKLVLTMRTSPRAAHIQQEADLSPYAEILATDPGRMLPGTVESVVRYGAFVRLAEGCSGFLHISQLKPRAERVSNVSDVVTVGQEVQVRLRDVDQDLKRVNLSLLPLSGATSAAATKDVSPLASADRATFRAGTVSAVHDYGAFVAVDGVDGLLHISKIEEGVALTPAQLRERLSVGQEVSVRILSVDVAANKLSLTMIADKPEPDLSALAARSPEEWIEGSVVSTTTYGAFVHLGDGIDGMVHISELGEGRVDAVTDVLNVGDAVKVRVIEVVPAARKVRLSMREFGAAEAAPRGAASGGARRGRGARGPKDVSAYAAMGAEEWVEGKVVSFTPFGAFVALPGGVDGLLHVSEMASGRVEAPQDVLSEGQEIKVRVIDVDTEAGRIGLSLRQARRAPVSRDLSVLAGVDTTAFVPGTVTSVVSYGCFVALDDTPGIEGLLHVSQLSEDRVEEVGDVVAEGDKVQVRVVEVDLDAGKVNLSMLPVGSAKDRSRNARRGTGEDGAADDASDPFGTGERRKSPRPRFNDYEDSALNVGGGEADWQKYLNQYFEKKDSA